MNKKIFPSLTEADREELRSNGRKMKETTATSDATIIGFPGDRPMASDKNILRLAPDDGAPPYYPALPGETITEIDQVDPVDPWANSMRRRSRAEFFLMSGALCI